MNILLPNTTRRFALGITALLLAMVPLLLPAMPAHAQGGVSCASSVRVQAGETLSAIAARELGSLASYQQIVAATNAAAAVDADYAAINDPGRIAVGWLLCIPGSERSAPATTPSSEDATAADTDAADDFVFDPDRLTIEYLRSLDFPGSELVIDQELDAGSNYRRYVAAYESEGLTIYGLLTVPDGQAPAAGWPAILFNHGYIPPAVYRTTERYVAYQDGFARSGYVTFKPDYRGHGFSEGQARSGYGLPDYAIDVLNATASVKQLPYVDSDRMGMWGHSMGGYLTVRAMLADPDIQVGVIWGGVVASYPDIMTRWTRSAPRPSIPDRARRWREEIAEQVGTPEENPDYWASISANSFVDELAGPIQLHHGSNDGSVPLLFSELLYEEIQAAGGEAELHVYEGDDHNLSQQFNTAMARSVAFFDAALK